MHPHGGFTSCSNLVWDKEKEMNWKILVPIILGFLIGAVVLMAAKDPITKI